MPTERIYKTDIKLEGLICVCVMNSLPGLMQSCCSESIPSFLNTSDTSHPQQSALCTPVSSFPLQFFPFTAPFITNTINHMTQPVYNQPVFILPFFPEPSFLTLSTHFTFNIILLYHVSNPCCSFFMFFYRFRLRYS